ncbi:MAG: methyltransferase 21A [Trebouxia sp. A1-2]|nr:MAG: methyltransferase 21A [Trebouxia sp. A1-2]
MSMRHLVEARQQDENTDADAPQKQSSSDTSKFLRSWAWKREHRPDKTRFHRPYIHFMTSPAVKLTLQQSKFDAEGFASTIWDSSIVMSKYFERWDGRWVGKKCLDLSAGCGLVGIVLARLGADVVLTDLLPNLPLLADNCKANVPEDASGSVIVKEHRWGERLADLGGPFDVIVACGVLHSLID